jgi:hypothetical protein
MDMRYGKQSFTGFVPENFHTALPEGLPAGREPRNRRT